MVVLIQTVKLDNKLLNTFYCILPLKYTAFILLSTTSTHIKIGHPLLLIFKLKPPIYIE